MNFGQAVSSGFKRYIDFSGRSSRSEYWWWYVFSFLGNIATSMVVLISPPEAAGLAGFPSALFQLVMILPSIAVGVRRLHDIDRTGWWLLISFTIVGIIPLLVWFCTKGTAGSNRFGNDPFTA